MLNLDVALDPGVCCLRTLLSLQRMSAKSVIDPASALLAEGNTP
jgi:hypothetical protein